MLLLGWLSFRVGWADEFKLANGNVLRGELASVDEDGLVVKLEVGGFSKREPWINFSQETLKELAKNPKAAPLVEPFIELEPEQIKAKEKQKEIVVKPVSERMERPSPKPGLGTAFITPIGLTLLAVLLLANLYAAYEIAFFRQQPVPLVCGLSVLFPLLAPRRRPARSRSTAARKRRPLRRSLLRPPEDCRWQPHQNRKRHPRKRNHRLTLGVSSRLTVAFSKRSSPASSGWCRAKRRRTW